MKLLKLVGSDEYIKYIYMYEDEYDAIELTTDIDDAIDVTKSTQDTLDYVAKEIMTQHNRKVQVLEIL